MERDRAREPIVPKWKKYLSMQQLVEIGESEISHGAPRCPETGLHVSLLPLIDHPSQAEWKDLAARALVPNIFYEAEYAVPAAVPFGPDIMLLTVTEGPSIYSRMLGAWPVRISSRRWGIPLRVLVGWTHPFAALGVPLLDRDRAHDVLRVLLSASRLLPGIPTRIFLPNIPEDGPFAEVLGSLEREHGLRSHRYNSHVRAKMLPKSRKDYFESHLSARTRSKLRQQFRRIEKCGATTFETISEPSAVASAVEDYIALEGRGWKARAGTAITCSASEADFLRQATANLAATRRIKVHRLVLNGTTIASSLTYLSPSMAWYAKISFDRVSGEKFSGLATRHARHRRSLAGPGDRLGGFLRPARPPPHAEILVRGSANRKPADRCARTECQLFRCGPA